MLHILQTTCMPYLMPYRKEGILIFHKTKSHSTPEPREVLVQAHSFSSSGTWLIKFEQFYGHPICHCFQDKRRAAITNLFNLGEVEATLW